MMATEGLPPGGGGYSAIGGFGEPRMEASGTDDFGAVRIRQLQQHAPPLSATSTTNPPKICTAFQRLIEEDPPAGPQ